MIERFSPEARVQLGALKNFILKSTDTAMISERALMLYDLPADAIDAGIAAFRRDCAKSIEGVVPQNMIAGLALATTEILRDKIGWLQAAGSGKA
jgi:hypothetical protein